MSDPEQREEALFEAALKLPTTERVAFLDKTCAGDADLRRRVGRLLDAFERAGSFLKQTTADERTARLTALPTEKAGDRIGRYKLLEQIGEGGCGVVYVAEQEEPVRRRVALKVIKLGMDTKQVIARFEAERQALAMMDHPNIAKVLDGGATETGRPYFVMELVRGIKITDYCDEHHLSARERLDLFVQVCRAIQHAHQKGIIHRDIKPSNILVASNDGVAVPKVIDFGIAKATQGRLTDQTVYTAFEQFIGTPAYMSPEQAQLSMQDIDTRTDIYSLGVLLYELLTGRTPFDAEELLSKGLDEMRRTIREIEPVKPSTRLTQELAVADGGPHTSSGSNEGRIRADSRRLLQEVRGDLDWIVMKCLEKERGRRYETANGLATDIQRHLNCEVVQARPPSLLYEFQKTVRRHKFGFAAATAILVALAVGVAVSTSQAVRARRAQNRERQARAAADEARLREAAQRQLAEENSHRARESQDEAQRLLYAADMKLAQTAWEEGNFSRMVNLLDAHRPKMGEPDQRGFEYFYFQELAKGEQEYVLSGHTNAVVALAVSPDGKYLATRSATDTRLWDLAERALVGAWPSAQTPMSTVYLSAFGISFSHDSRYLAFPSKEGLNFYELATRQLSLVRTGEVAKPLFNPNSSRMALSSGAPGSGTVIWDYETDKELGVLGPDCAAWSWSPDGLRLLAGSSYGAGGQVDLWDATSLKRIATNRFGQYIYGATLSPDGQQLAVEDWQGEVAILDSATCNIQGSMDAGDTRSAALCFSPDGKSMATPSRDQAIIIWNVQSRQRSRLLRGHRAKVTSLTYTPDGRRLLSADLEGKVLVWDLAHDSPGTEIPNRFRSWGSNGPHFSRDGKFLALQSEETESIILDTSSWQTIATVEGQVVAFSPDSRDFAFATKRRREPVLCVSAIGVSAPRAILHLETGRSVVNPMEVSPLGDYASQYTLHSPSDSALSVFDCTVHEELIAERSTRLTSFPNSFLADNHTWVCAIGSELHFWDLQSRRTTRVLKCRRPIDCIAVSPDARLLAASQDDLTIALWDLEAGSEVAAFAGHPDRIWILEFSPDGRTLASGSEDRSVILWDVAARREAASFLQEKPVYWLKFSPDNQMLVVGSIGSYRIWRAPREAAQPALPLTSHAAMTEVPPGSIWRAPDGEGPQLPHNELEKTRCFTNLTTIHAAIVAYRKDHGQMPDWLSDLVPQYLTDTNCLICPMHARIGMPADNVPTIDPKLTTCYSYEFNASTNRFSDPFGLAEPGDTMRSWKTRQLAHYGSQVPVLRCGAHASMLNVTYAGEPWETERMWECAAELRLRTKDPAGMEAWVRQLEQDKNVGVLSQFAWSWASSFQPEARNGAVAVRLAEIAARLSQRKDPSILDTLAVAYAEVGQFDKAVSTESEAIAKITASARAAETDSLLRDFRSRMELFAQRRPYRE